MCQRSTIPTEYVVQLSHLNVCIHFILQDVLEVKKNLTRINGLISVIATLIMFSSFEVAVIGNNL